MSKRLNTHPRYLATIFSPGIWLDSHQTSIGEIIKAGVVEPGKIVDDNYKYDSGNTNHKSRSRPRHTCQTGFSDFRPLSCCFSPNHLRKLRYSDDELITSGTDVPFGNADPARSAIVEVCHKHATAARHQNMGWNMMHNACSEIHLQCPHVAEPRVCGKRISLIGLS